MAKVKKNALLKELGLKSSASLLEIGQKLKEIKGEPIPDSAFQSNMAMRNYLAEKVNDFDDAGKSNQGSRRKWKERLKKVFDYYNLDMPQGTVECAKAINNNQICVIEDINSKSKAQLKQELCIMRKAWDQGKDITFGGYGTNKKKKKPKRSGSRTNKSDDFYRSWAWKKLRFNVLKYYGAKCMLCGSEKYICVDHILPRKKFPHLELDFNNLQVLCNSCNMGKSNDDYTDFRPSPNQSEA